MHNVIGKSRVFTTFAPRLREDCGNEETFTHGFVQYFLPPTRNTFDAVAMISDMAEKFYIPKFDLY